ncbi:MAG: NAD(P)-binding domain-containing protein [Actinobacteria bacterium]|nr:NAD(P)-binding domain-containing protein [Actinomycetota bacterium]MBU1494081.1 NAD(P)-binding domain-containing protein [Actinomycetota bacterium]
MVTEVDVAVVGAGSAGLGIGYYLQQVGLSFLIVERGRIGESWRSQRWDSFVVNTPNWMNTLPGSPYQGADNDGFCSGRELVESLERHASTHALPIRSGTTVTRVGRAEDTDHFVVETLDNAGARDSIRTRNVVLASGSMNSPKVPAPSGRLPDSVEQLHAADYRSPAGLSEGAIVVIGSGQSGCQIAEELIGAGRTVYLCTSRVARVPRRYRGRDTLSWMRDMGLLDQEVGDLPDPVMEFAAQPQVSGVGVRGRTVSLQGMQRQGVGLMGRLVGIVDGVLTTDDRLADHVAFADGFSAQFKRDVDTHIAANGIDAPGGEDDPIDAPAGPEIAEAGLTTLDLAAAGVTTVIWCTGFRASFDWLQVPVTDDLGRPVHVRGVSPVPGIYFLGFPWLHSRKSGIIFGIDEDARHITETITSRTH